MSLSPFSATGALHTLSIMHIHQPTTAATNLRPFNTASLRGARSRWRIGCRRFCRSWCCAGFWASPHGLTAWHVSHVQRVDFLTFWVSNGIPRGNSAESSTVSLETPSVVLSGLTTAAPTLGQAAATAQALVLNPAPDATFQALTLRPCLGDLLSVHRPPHRTTPGWNSASHGGVRGDVIPGVAEF